jgi:hypothetical protein
LDNRSFIAAFLGNLLGAFLVALPATYFYLMDYDADILRSVENGAIAEKKSEGSSDSDRRR